MTGKSAQSVMMMANDEDDDSVNSMDEQEDIRRIN